MHCNIVQCIDTRLAVRYKTTDLKKKQDALGAYTCASSWIKCEIKLLILLSAQQMTENQRYNIVLNNKPRALFLEFR